VSDGAPQRMQRLTIMLRSRDHCHHHSLALELLARAKRTHMAGATLFQGVEGQGRSGDLHRDHLLREDSPLSLVIVDEPEKIAAFLAAIRPVAGGALVVIDDVVAFRA
jgi:PII-like signaling protein